MKTINEINQNIESTLNINENYEVKKEKLKLSPVKLRHVFIVGTLSGLASLCFVDNSDLSLMELAFFGSYTLGCIVPYIVKKIRISELDFQINQNNKILDDLEREKEKILNKRYF